MILTDLNHIRRYAALSPAMATAIQWLENLKDFEFELGDIELDNGVVVKPQKVALQPRDVAVLEAHERFIDIHVPLKDDETMGWAPVERMKYPRAEYDQANDFITYGDSAHSMLHVRVGQAAIFFPEDAHAPNIGLGRHHKLCIKVPV